ncbi:glyoxalase [Flavobacteriales bacterium]|jgi:hypothetical protein|nr:glyoxalase [Flavobacteriales bacterium]
MHDRNQTLLALRPNIDTITDSLNTKDIESFQNKVLRPILKFQNHLLLHLFVHYARQYKGVFFKLNNQQQLKYIHQSLSTNQSFKSKLIGTVVGLFTTEEYVYYSQNLSALNKRIISMSIQRLQDQLEFLGS